MKPIATLMNVLYEWAQITTITIPWPAASESYLANMWLTWNSVSSLASLQATTGLILSSYSAQVIMIEWQEAKPYWKPEKNRIGCWVEQTGVHETQLTNQPVPNNLALTYTG